jgi:hypothetical protein
MRPETRILYSFCVRRIAVLAARSAARDTGNQSRALRDIKGRALDWFTSCKSKPSTRPVPNRFTSLARPTDGGATWSVAAASHSKSKPAALDIEAGLRVLGVPGG